MRPASTPSIAKLYPPSPPGVPPELTAAPLTYRRSAWIACIGLFGFAAIYLGLTGYLAWLVYRLLAGAIFHRGNIVFAVLLSLPPLFFLGFLVRGLFITKRRGEPLDIELHPRDEPTLFAFLTILADEIGAPRPHRVFLAPNVNAGVFYDLSFWNFLIPTKKNLVLGMGLLNSVSLDELKAVLAHEFGHFAQRSMAVGRWVYTAEQVAGHIIMSRSFFDRALHWLSSIDLRVAWIGWIMRVFVWAIRAVLDSFFRIVVLADRALAREMEFQADRVAVSVSGSDSLIHALHRLPPATDAYNEAFAFFVEELDHGRPAADFYSIQAAALEHLRRIRGEPNLGKTPKAAERRPQAHRVFTTELAQPPQMWSTHPPSRSREDHAKAIYVPSVLDPREAWSLFIDPDKLRVAMTAKLAVALRKPTPTAPSMAPVAREVTLAKLEERFVRASLDPRYRGAYLGRSIAAHHAKASEMISNERSHDRERVLHRIQTLYPETLQGELKNYRELRGEEAMLLGLKDGILKAPGGVIRYQGEEVPRKDLQGLVDRVQKRRKEAEERLISHDRLCRALHLDAARLLGQGWDRYLESLIRLLHFLTHAGRNVADAHSTLHHVLGIVLADGHVSNSERERLLHTASGLQEALEEVWRAKTNLVLPPGVLAQFQDSGGCLTLNQPLGANLPSLANLGDWMAIIDGWAAGATDDLTALAGAVLDTLLTTEESVEAMLREGLDPGEAPELAMVPDRYTTCVLGEERERQKTLGWWDRFQTADGFLPGVLRFAVASSLLLPALLLGGSVGGSTIHIHNGLFVPVTVNIGGHPHHLSPGADGEVSVSGSSVHVETISAEGPIESFDESVGAFSTYAYNVANAALLREYTVVYASRPQDPTSRVIGAPRWLRATSDVIFAEPPRSVSVRRSRTARRTVLLATDGPAYDQVDDEGERRAMVAAHVRHDPLTHPYYRGWLRVSEPAAIRERAAREPGNVFLEAAFVESATGDERAEECSRLTARAEADRANPDLAYLRAQCIEDPDARGRAFETLHGAFPTHVWLATGAMASRAFRGEWESAYTAGEVALRSDDVSVRSETEPVFARIAAMVRQRGGDIPPTSFSDDTLRALLALEEDDEADDRPLFAAMRALRRGDLEESIRLTASWDVADRGHMVALVGASDGASPERVTEALRLSRAGLGGPSLLAIAALAARGGNDPGAYLDRVSPDQNPDDPTIFSRALSLLTSDPTAFEYLVAEGAPPRTRGLLLMMGLVVLGERAPPTWRGEVRALLFVSERPYFRPATQEVARK